MSPEARERATTLLSGHLTVIALGDFTSPLVRDRRGYLQDAALRETYAETLVDLHDLLEEIQFQVSLGAMVLSDAAIALREGRATPVQRPKGLEGIGFPVEVAALLAPYERQISSPGALFDDPHQHMSGGRLLSSWFAAQLFDSGIVRGIAALDRLAILLWTAAGRTMPLARGKPFAPSFTRHWLCRMSQDYQKLASWQPLVDYTEHALVSFAKGFRDGFVHRKRIPSALHGEAITSSMVSDQVISGLMPEEHEAISVAFYDAVLRPTVTLTGKVLVETPSSDTI